MNTKLQQDFDRLRTWAANLARTVDAVLPAMEETLNGNTRLPENCPSKESMAELELQEIAGALREVTAAVDDIGKALFPVNTPADLTRTNKTAKRRQSRRG